MKWGLKGGISIDTDSGLAKYVLWCCGGICHQPDTFIQIGSGHTVELKSPGSYGNSTLFLKRSQYISLDFYVLGKTQKAKCGSEQRATLKCQYFFIQLSTLKYLWSSAVCKILTFKVNILWLKLFESFFFNSLNNVIIRAHF
jgi:hypothetical protein